MKNANFRHRKFLLKHVICFMLLVFSMIGITTVVSAADSVFYGNVKWPSKVSLPVGIMHSKGADFITKEFSQKIKISATSSNSKIAKVDAGVEKTYDKKYYAYCYFVPKKEGTTNITIKVTVGKKTYTYKTKLSCYNWTAPFSSFKIGSTDYLSTIKANKSYKFLTSSYGKEIASFKKVKAKLTGKLAIKLKSGYKIKKISVFTNDGKGHYDSKTIKNNSKLPKYTSSITVYVYDTKKKCNTYYDLSKDYEKPSMINAHGSYNGVLYQNDLP